MLVRVNLNALLGAQTPPAAGETTQTSLMTYDLLVTGADTGSPRVVSWGGAGTGTVLPASSTSRMPSSRVSIRAPTARFGSACPDAR